MASDPRPIWALPQRAERKPRYTREQITEAALRIADTEGFDAVTMKRIAVELGASTMRMYYYVRNKADIIALMQDAILADILVPGAGLSGGWRDAVSAIARRTRRVLIDHPWSLMSFNEAQFGPNAMRHIEQSLAAAAKSGLPATAWFELTIAIDDYVAGNALHVIETLTRAAIAEADPAMVTAAIEYGITLLGPGEFPQLSAMYAAQANREAPPDGETAAEAEAAPDGEAAAEAEAAADGEAAAGPPMTEDAMTRQFEHGLAALLDGLATRLDRLRSARAARLARRGRGGISAEENCPAEIKEAILTPLFPRSIYFPSTGGGGGRRRPGEAR